MAISNMFVGGSVLFIALISFTAPPSPDWRTGAIVFGAMLLGTGMGEFKAMRKSMDAE